MGNFRCYLCSKEFWRESSLEKHLEKKECPRLQELEVNTPDGNQRSNAIFNVVDLLIKQNKTEINGIITHRDSKTDWSYEITKLQKSED